MLTIALSHSLASFLWRFGEKREEDEKSNWTVGSNLASFATDVFPSHVNIPLMRHKLC